MRNRYIIHFLFIIIPILFGQNLFSQEIAPSELARKKVVERMDKKGLRFQTKAVIEKSKKMLEVPESIRHLNDFTVAKTPPTIEFTLVPLENRFQAAVPKEVSSRCMVKLVSGKLLCAYEQILCSCG